MTEQTKSFLQEVTADFAKDSKKESDGVWMVYKRFEYLIARAHRNNKKFVKLMEERLRPYQWAIDRGNLQALRDIANDVMQGVYAETILLGVRRVDTHEELPYTSEDGALLFKSLPDFWDEVFRFAGSGEVYAPDQVAADSGN